MSNECYTDAAYQDLVETHIFSKVVFGNATTQATATQFRLPYKAKLVKFGVITQGTDVHASTLTGFALRYSGRMAGTSTELATFVPGGAADTDIASFTATGCAPETATNIPKNRLVEPHVKFAQDATVQSFGFYMEYQRVWDSGN